jgi:hypothetical protein
MADWLKPARSAARRAGRAPATNPVLARYLDDLRMAQQARELDIHFGRVPGPKGMFDDIALPDAPDPVSLQRAVGAAPRSWLAEAELGEALQPRPSSPLADMLLDNDRRRSLLSSRLERMTPEQQARSLPAVGRQYTADQAAARAADIKYGKDVNTAAALAAAGIVGGGAMYGRMSQLSDEMIRQWADNEFDFGPDLSGDPAGAMPMSLDLEDDAAVDAVANAVADMEMPLVKARPPRDFDAEDMMANPPGGDELMGDAARQLSDLFAEDAMVELSPDSPEDAVANAPGPALLVGGNMNIEDLPGPQMRSIKALMRGGIPERRAVDIILRGSSMSPDEYRMVTGGRR